MESDKLSTDRAKARGSERGELQGTREHEEGDTSPVKGVASATGSPSGDLGRQELREALKGYGPSVRMSASAGNANPTGRRTASSSLGMLRAKNLQL